MIRFRSFQTALALAITSAAVAWTAAVLVVGLRHAEHTPPLFRAAVHAAGHLVCHQRSDRSFHVHGRQLPVCARCTGLYLSGAAGAIAGWFGLPLAPRRTRRLVVLAAIPTALTLAFEWSGAGGVSNTARALSAVPLGAAVTWLFVRMLRAEGAPSTCAMIA